MKVDYSSRSLKIVCLVLVVVLLISLCCGYVFYDHYKSNSIIVNIEKQLIIKDLKNTQNKLEFAAAENKTLNTELVLERQKVSALLEEIGNANFDISSVIKYKNEVLRLNKVVLNLKKENSKLSKINDSYKRQRDSTILVLGNSKKYKDSLSAIKENLFKTIKNGSKFVVLNLKVEPLNQQKIKEAVVTYKASQVNLLKVSFSILSNKLDRPYSKQYYIQIIDKENNIIGLNKSKKFGNSVLYYSCLTDGRIEKENESVPVTEYILGENLLKGMYYINIFDKDELVSKSTFTLI
ncbi:hypothetical protein FNW52_12210 [Flavobacterium sp. ZT3R18]|uniref:hypothetical protein n=1 Tax=Flavobacterium sp. ZT3R18 TaxID=2594429 RepID=UPI001179FCEE|nr:hypothetical protein [Flavobacterium sp. ZT3R18]TRX35182.1 hypothetical protein FNW52_12210 [Flavobacterium sp. ZT3R18]